MTIFAISHVPGYTKEEPMTSRDNNLYTLQDVAKLLLVSERSVYRYIDTGKLKATKIGHWRITKLDLDAFLNNGVNIQKNMQ